MLILVAVFHEKTVRLYIANLSAPVCKCYDNEIIYWQVQTGCPWVPILFLGNSKACSFLDMFSFIDNIL